MKNEKIQKKAVTTQAEAFNVRGQLFSWFKRYTFGNCSDIESIVVTRDTVQNFIDHNPALGILHRYEERPQGYEVYGGEGILIVDLGEFRLCYKD